MKTAQISIQNQPIDAYFDRPNTPLWGYTDTLGIDTMSDESTLERPMSEFVDDLNNGEEPRLLDCLVDHPDETEELLPLMNFVSGFKAATMGLSEQGKEDIRTAIRNKLFLRS